MNTRVVENMGKYTGQVLEEVFSREVIEKRIDELAKQISTDYAGKVPILIGVLNGSVFFLADLAKRLEIDCEMDFIKVSSYHSGTQSSGTVRLLKDISCIITDRDVIIVEDIIDSGLTARFLKHRILENQPASVAFATLLFKPECLKLEFEAEYVGFEVADRFLVGYGLDLDQKFRNLPSIWAFPVNMNL
ncbi:MAG: hypoxanthine phosphoribosyltransferase [Candidatus Marinimicrobia bacterium]|nr:hypoxanthine phosphoribosyltransferase [FCB group bacterium]MBL7026211.1 hypoxanthine phosphoribosyltransferase [Candidatus Neomarinimicrobiota bacterium]